MQCNVCISVLQAVEVMMEYDCDTLYSEGIAQEVLVVVKECLMEEWARGDWSAVSVGEGYVME